MRIADVIGKVVLNRCDPNLVGGRFPIVRPLNLEALRGEGPPTAEIVVAYDELGAMEGLRVGFSEGREAAMPFHPKPVVLDAYVGCLLDDIQIKNAAR